MERVTLGSIIYQDQNTWENITNPVFAAMGYLSTQTVYFTMTKSLQEYDIPVEYPNNLRYLPV